MACFLPNGHLFFPGSPAIGHFLRCDNQDAVYEECPLTTRHSVRIPLRAPPSGEPMVMNGKDSDDNEDYDDRGQPQEVLL